MQIHFYFKQDKMEDNLINKLNSYPSRWMIAPGRGGMIAEGQKGGNSPFATLLINSLQGNKKEKLLISELVQDLIRNTSNDFRQIPIGGVIAGVGDQGGQFVFRIKKFQDKDDWDKANIDKSVESYQKYLNKYPKGTYSSIAKSQIKNLEEQNFWNSCLTQLNEQVFNEYIQSYPNGKFISESRAFLNILSNSNSANQKESKELEIFCFELCTKFEHFKKFKHIFPESHLINEVDLEIKRLSEFINKETISKCKEKFIGGKIDDIFTILLSKKMDEDFENDFFHISHRWNILYRDKDRGILRTEEFTKMSNQISMSLLNLLNKIEKEL